MNSAQKLKQTILITFSCLVLLFSLGCSSIPRENDRAERAPAKTQRFPFLPGEVAIGMRMNDVAQAWGDPSRVQVAGDTTSGNQRWIYADSATQSWGGVGSARVIYFEKGQVVGWEQVRSR